MDGISAKLSAINAHSITIELSTGEVFVFPFEHYQTLKYYTIAQLERVVCDGESIKWPELFLEYSLDSLRNPNKDNIRHDAIPKKKKSFSDWLMGPQSPEPEKDLKQKPSEIKKENITKKDCLTGCISLFVIIFCIGFVIYSLQSCVTSCSKERAYRAALKLKPKPEPQEEKIDPYSPSEAIDKAWIFTQYVVESQLLSPKSAKFPPGIGSRYVKDLGDGYYLIDSYVDAKNAFNQEIRQHFLCKLRLNEKNKFEVILFYFK